MFIDGYKFWFGFKTDKTRCCRYNSSKCQGKCAVDENGKIRHTSEHNHPPEPNRALLDIFRKSLTRRAAKESTELYKIYCDESNKHIDAALLYPFTSAESAMRKARRKQLPKSPNNIKDIINTLDHNKDLFRVHSGSDKDALYQKTITVDDCVCMIFMHRKTFDLFSGRIEELHVDSSFQFITQSLPNYFLITFHAVQGSINAPIIYSVSTAKTQSACSSIFAYVRDELNIRPNMFISDFDPIMQTSLSYIYPDTAIKGCWFHYTDAVLNQMKLLNLQKETTKGLGASALRMLLVLPLLPPEYMVPGLEATKKWMKEKTILSDGLSNLCDFVENNWLRSVGTKRMSIFGTTKISSNHLNSFNKELSAVIGQQKPVIWVILDSLTQLATKIYVKTSRKLKNLKNAANQNMNDFSSNSDIIKDGSNIGLKKKLPNVPGKSMKRKDLISETVISSATQVWIKTPVHLRNPLLFLQLVSHCINDTMYLDHIPDIKERSYMHSVMTPSTTVTSEPTPSTNPSNIVNSQNKVETISIESIITTQPQSHTSLSNQSYSTSTWNTSGHSDVLQNCISPFKDLQNPPNSPSLSVILQENTFNCPGITHQEFLLAQPGQAPLDSQQSTYTSCFAQNSLNINLSGSQESEMHIQQIQCDNQTQNYFIFDECHNIGSQQDSEKNHTISCSISNQVEHCTIQPQEQEQQHQQHQQIQQHQQQQQIQQHQQQQHHQQHHHQQHHHQHHHHHHLHHQQQHQSHQQHQTSQQQEHQHQQLQNEQHSNIDHRRSQQNSKCNQETEQYNSIQVGVQNVIENNKPQIISNTRIINGFQKSLEPPPLVFFSSVKRFPCKRILPILSEPPPLVPISNIKINGIKTNLNNGDINLSKN